MEIFMLLFIIIFIVAVWSIEKLLTNILSELKEMNSRR